MTAFDALMIFWALPSLVVLLVLIRLGCYLGERTVSSMAFDDWVACLYLSIIYPFGIIGIALGLEKSGILTKPISEIWKK